MPSRRLLPLSNHLAHLLVLMGLLLLGLPTVFAAETVVFPVTPPPAGANPAAYPTPKEDWFVRFESNLAHTRGHKYDLLFDGDSITDFWQTTGKAVWDQHYGQLNAVDFGISGDRTEHVLWRLMEGQVDGMDPKLIVLMIGTNNLKGNSADQIAGGIKAIVAQYLQLCPHAHLLLLGIFPRAASPTDPDRAKIADINQQIAPLGSNSRVTYLDIGKKFLQPDGSLTADIMPDFLHPTAKGYEIWAEAIQPVVDKFCPAPAP